MQHFFSESHRAKLKDIKISPKGSSVGVNFMDCEKPEVCAFLLFRGQHAIFARIFFFGLTILSSDVILGRISKIYRAFLYKGRQRKHNYEGHRDHRIWPHCSKQAQQFPVSAEILLLKVFLSVGHWGCLHAINSNVRLRLIKGKRKTIRFKC